MSHSTTQFGDKKRKKGSFCHEGRRGGGGETDGSVFPYFSTWSISEYKHPFLVQSGINSLETRNGEMFELIITSYNNRGFLSFKKW